MLGHMGHEEIDKSIEKVIWSFKYPIHNSEKFDVPCESMILELIFFSTMFNLTVIFSEFATRIKRN